MKLKLKSSIKIHNFVNNTFFLNKFIIHRNNHDMEKIFTCIYFKKKFKYYNVFRFNYNNAYSFSKNYKFYKYINYKILNYNTEKIKLIISLKYLYYLVDFIFEQKKENLSYFFLVNKVNFIFFNNLMFILKFFNKFNYDFYKIIFFDNLNNKSFFKKKASIKRNRLKQIKKKIKIVRYTTNKLV